MLRHLPKTARTGIPNTPCAPERPTCDYAIHATENLLLASSSRTTRGIRHALLCGFYARSGARVTASDIRQLIRAACRFWKHQVFVYAGINNSLPYLPGFAAPEPAPAADPGAAARFRGGGQQRPALRRFQLTDSDFI